MYSFPQAPRNAARRFAMGAPILLLCVGCASTPPPTENLRAAQQAIANAERVEAATHAAVELGSARSKLTSANSAVAEKEMETAQRLADEARADAELAAARSTVGKAKAVNEEMKRATATLVEEMQRRTGGTK